MAIAIRNYNETEITGKVCKRCHSWKPLDQYHPRKDGKFGRNARCKDCQNEYLRTLRDRDRDHYREQARGYYAADTEKHLAHGRSWKERNPDKIKAYSKQKYEANPEEMRRRSRQFRIDNAELCREKDRQRRVREHGCKVEMGLHEWEKIKKAFGYRCAYCGCKPEKLTQDHVIPLSMKGSHSIDNVVPACKTCNDKKRNNPAPPFVVQPNFALE